jgi:phenylpyruvate tautomerase PptA (4-oxalocrotonate tautomerase family)
MPLARIDLVEGKSAEFRRTVGEVIYLAMLKVLNAPEGDRFQVITEHPSENLIADKNYLGVTRTADSIFIQITLNEGRGIDTKKAFYKAVADGLHEQLAVRREDVLINLVEVRKSDWSFGNGEAQYVT